MINKNIKRKIKRKLREKNKRELIMIIVKKIEREKINYGLTNMDKGARSKILQRDNYNCVLCGDNEDFHVHHFKPRLLRKGTHEGWRITLCKYCHWYLHSNPKYRVYHSDLVKMAVRKEGGVTKSYKGKKWGRKSIDDRIIEKIRDLRKKGRTIREIESLLSISRGAVHKYIKSDKQNCEVEQDNSFSKIKRDKLNN